MELIKVLEAFGLKVVDLDKLSDEELQSMIDEHLKTQNEHINSLESEKQALSKSNEELTTSVEGYKSSEEKLNKELSDTKNELAVTKGKLEQVTDMYKEQFTKDPEQQEVSVKDNDSLKNDVLQQILDTK